MNTKFLKKLLALALFSTMIFGLLTACGGTTYKSFTFSVDNGDKIKIKLNTTDGYNITSDLPFAISYNGETYSEGSFIQGEAYQQYVDIVNAGNGAKLLDSGEKEGIEYIFWSFNDSEYNYAILVKGSNTGIILGNPVSEETARECFNRLTISLEN